MLEKLVELWRYRELTYNLTVRDLKVRYKNSVLGIAWSLLNPLLMMMVFTLVYTVMLGQSNRHDYPVFILSGLLPWNFFSASIMGGTASVVSNSSLIKKVYFPRETLPLALLLSNLVNFLVALPMLVVLSLLLGVQLTAWALMLPSSWGATAAGKAICRVTPLMVSSPSTVWSELPGVAPVELV